MTWWYLIPDFATPSWGIGMLYGHVHLLNGLEVPAVAVHEGPGSPAAWMDVEVPTTDRSRLDPGPDDVVVVPEVLIGDERLAHLHGRKLVFVQGSFILLQRLATSVRARESGYLGAMAILPHVAEAAEQLCDLPVELVPPFVAPYFAVDRDRLDDPRPRRVTTYAKDEVPDYPVALDLLRRARDGQLPGLVAGADLERVASWELVELKGRSHREAATLLRETELFLNLNCWEAFNTTVPEAMAAGAAVVCYQAYGGRDYLVDGDNAMVFPNNWMLPLVHRALSLMALPDEERHRRLARMRRAAWLTAAGYNMAATARGLERAVARWAP